MCRPHKMRAVAVCSTHPASCAEKLHDASSGRLHRPWPEGAGLYPQARELFHPGQGMYLHDFDRGLRNLQMRMTLERLSRRFMRLRLHDRIQHDVVFTIRYPLDSNELGLTYPGPYISEHICMIAHPFLPFSLHLVFRSLPPVGIGFFPFG